MVGFRMKAAFLALMAISASLAVAQHPMAVAADDPKCASASTKRVECGHSGTDQTECEEVHGCCWSPLTPDPTEAPWSVHADLIIFFLFTLHYNLCFEIPGAFTK